MQSSAARMKLVKIIVKYFVKSLLHVNVHWRTILLFNETKMAKINISSFHNSTTVTADWVYQYSNKCMICWHTNFVLWHKVLAIYSIQKNVKNGKVWQTFPSRKRQCNANNKFIELRTLLKSRTNQLYRSRYSSTAKYQHEDHLT